jgi:hypothetical protein
MDHDLVVIEGEVGRPFAPVIITGGLSAERASAPVGFNILTPTRVPIPVRTNAATAAVNKIVLRM